MLVIRTQQTEPFNAVALTNFYSTSLRTLFLELLLMWSFVHCVTFTLKLKFFNTLVHAKSTKISTSATINQW